jgi:8-oxo-dGTP pyrophosphatase MutT (NUDIX family)
MRVAAVIYDISSGSILIGKESYYCFEKSDNPIEQARLDMIEECTESEAINYAIQFSILFQTEIRYSEFEHGKTHFVCQTNNSHWGIVKGHGEPHETPLEAISRETYEEVGLIVPHERWNRLILPHIHRPTHTFCLMITKEERKQIEHHIEERKRRHCGELFDLAFRNIFTLRNPINHITRHLRSWMFDHSLSFRATHIPLSFSPLLNFVPHEIYYQYDYIKEPEFVWGKRRFSILPITETCIE